MSARISDPATGCYHPLVRWDLDVAPRRNSRGALAPLEQANPKSAPWYWGFHTLLGGIDLEDVRFRPRFVGVVDVWKDF